MKVMQQSIGKEILQFFTAKENKGDSRLIAFGIVFWKNAKIIQQLSNLILREYKRKKKNEK